MAEIYRDFSPRHKAHEEQQSGFDARRKISTFEGNPWWKVGGKDRTNIPIRTENSRASLYEIADADHCNTVVEGVFENPRSMKSTSLSRIMRVAIRSIRSNMVGR